MPNPTTYRKEYCEQVRSLMKDGYSVTAVAGSLGVGRQRIYDWAKRHKELAEALEVGRSARVYKLEQGLYKAASGPEVTAHIFALKNACPDEWREKQEIAQHNTGEITFKTVYEGG